ncbi:hypothetical protein PIB30_002589 [Stylosanthes scabra]|uniref:Uncharacterized protein n=1 Tax=Stylosanthes scabra TaxID=79078 RepID=A0ABU6Z1P7_9FABA|nr:hypothetical protein [Stylosanthes scabra]
MASRLLPSPNNFFKEAFDKHQRKFKGDITKVQTWSSALKEASDLSGFHYPSKYHIRSVESMLAIESSKVRIIGIWGMGGIGNRLN